MDNGAAGGKTPPTHPTALDHVEATGLQCLQASVNLLPDRIEDQTLKKLSIAQETYSKAILGWNTGLPGPAAISDLGWLHITRELMLARCSLYARFKGLPDAPVYARMKDMLDAAARINMGWSYHTKAMFQAAISPVQPPSCEIT